MIRRRRMTVMGLLATIAMLMIASSVLAATPTDPNREQQRVRTTAENQYRLEVRTQSRQGDDVQLSALDADQDRDQDRDQDGTCDGDPDRDQDRDRLRNWMLDLLGRLCEAVR